MKKYILKTIDQIKEKYPELLEKIINNHRYFNVEPFETWLELAFQTVGIEKIIKENNLDINIENIEIDLERGFFNFKTENRSAEIEIFEALQRLFENDIEDQQIFEGLLANEYLFDASGKIVIPFKN